MSQHSQLNESIEDGEILETSQYQEIDSNTLKVSQKKNNSVLSKKKAGRNSINHESSTSKFHRTHKSLTMPKTSNDKSDRDHDKYGSFSKMEEFRKCVFPPKEKNSRKERRVDRSTRTLSLEKENSKQNSDTHHHHHHRSKRRRRPHSRKKATAKNRSRNRSEEEGRTESDSNDSDGQTRSYKRRHRSNESAKSDAGRADRKHRSRSSRSRSRSRSCDRLMHKWKKRAIDKTKLGPIMDDSRLKDNVLMRKLLQSESLGGGVGVGGGGAKAVADNTSDLSCEVGSLSTISSPDYTFLESMRPPVESPPQQQEATVVACSDDSEIEVIIPHKPPPPVIELDSDGEEEEEEEPAPGSPQQSASSEVAQHDEDDLNALHLRAIALKSAMLRKYQDRVERDRRSAVEEMRLQQQQARLSAMREMILQEEQDSLEQEQVLAVMEIVDRNHSVQDALAERRDKYMRQQLALNKPIKWNFTDVFSSSEEDDRERDSYHPSNRTSPMSPTSSYNFSPTQECHTEQDIDIDDPDENVEQPRIFEQTYDGSNNAWFAVLGPQPLPPGVDVSNLPPEFSDTVFSAPPPPPPPLPPPDADHRFGFQGGFPPPNYNHHPHTFVGPHFGPVPHPNEPTSHVGQNFGPVPHPNVPASHMGQNFGPVPHPNVPTSHMGQNFGPVPHPNDPTSHVGQSFGTVQYPNVPTSHVGQNFGTVQYPKVPTSHVGQSFVPMQHPNEPSSHVGQNFGTVQYPNVPTSHVGQNFGTVQYPNVPTSHVGQNFGPVPHPNDPTSHVGQNFGPVPHPNDPTSHVGPNFGSMQNPDETMPHMGSSFVPAEPTIPPHMLPQPSFDNIPSTTTLPLHTRRTMENESSLRSSNISHKSGSSKVIHSTSVRQLEHCSVSGQDKLLKITKTIYTNSNRQLEPCVVTCANQGQIKLCAANQITNLSQLERFISNQTPVECSANQITNLEQLTTNQSSTHQRQLEHSFAISGGNRTNQRQVEHYSGNQTYQTSTHQRQVEHCGGDQKKSVLRTIYSTSRQLEPCVTSSANQRQLSEQASNNQLETLVQTVRQECAAAVEEGGDSTGVLEKNRSSDVGDVESGVFEVEEESDTDGTCNTDDENEERLRAKLLTALLQKKGKSDGMQLDTGDDSSKSSSRETSLSRKKTSSEPVDREDGNLAVGMNEESSSSCGRSDPIHKRDLADFIDTIRATTSSDVIHDSSLRPVSLATTKAVPPPNRIVSNRGVKVNNGGNQNLERVVVQNRGAKKRITTVARQSTAAARQSTAVARQSTTITSVARQSTAITPVTRQSTAAQEDSNKFIIRIGQDSEEESNGEDEENGRVWRRKVIMAAEEEKDSSVLAPAANPPAVVLEKSIDKLLEEVRRKHEVNKPSTSAAILEKTKPTTAKVVAGAKGVVKKGAAPKSASPKLTAPQATTSTKVSTPAAVKHLPKSAQEEYRRLKQAMVARERQKQMEAVRQRLLLKNRQAAATSCATSSATATSCVTPAVTGACVVINCVTPPVTAAIAVTSCVTRNAAATSCATPNVAATSDTISPANTTVAATSIQTPATSVLSRNKSASPTGLDGEKSCTIIVESNVMSGEKSCPDVESRAVNEGEFDDQSVLSGEKSLQTSVISVEKSGTPVESNVIHVEKSCENVSASAITTEKSPNTETVAEKSCTTLENNVVGKENDCQSISTIVLREEESCPPVAKVSEEGIPTNVISFENVLESASSSAVEKEKSSVVTLEEGITSVETNVASIENVSSSSAVEEEKSSPLVATEKSCTNAQLLSSVVEGEKSCTIESRSSSNDRESCPATPDVVMDENSQSLERSESCQSKSSSPQVAAESCATSQLPEIVAEKECSNSMSVVGKSLQSPAIVAECSNSVTVVRKSGSVVVLGVDKSCEISPAAAIGGESCKTVAATEESCKTVAAMEESCVAVLSSGKSCETPSAMVKKAEKSCMSVISSEKTFQSPSITLKEAEKSCTIVSSGEKSCQSLLVTAASAEKSCIIVSSSEKSCQTTPAIAEKSCMTQLGGSSAENSRSSSSSKLAEAEQKLISERYSAVDKLTELACDERAEAACRERVARLVLQLRAERAELASLVQRVERRAQIGQRAMTECARLERACKRLGGPKYRLPTAGQDLLRARSKSALLKKDAAIRDQQGQRKTEQMLQPNIETSLNDKEVDKMEVEVRQMDLVRDDDSSSLSNLEVDRRKGVEVRRRVGECDVNEIEGRSGDEGSGKQRKEEVCGEEMQVEEEENKEKVEGSVIRSSNRENRLKSLPDYVSPLNYMQNSVNVSNVRVESKKTIFCPYELMGSCRDETCPYQHSA